MTEPLGGITERARVIAIYSLLGFLSVTVFGTLHILVEHNPRLGYLELASGMVLALNLLAFRLTKNIELARALFLSALIALLIVMLASGGTGGTGIFWLFLFPVAAFFLTNKRQGVVWTAVLMGAVGLLWILAQWQLVSLWYGDLTIRQLLVSLLVVTVGIYVYEQDRERADKWGEESQHDLQEYLDRMTTYTAKVDPRGKILFANRAAKEATGLGERLIGANFLDGAWWSFDEAVQRRVKAAFDRALAGEAINYDERFQMVDKEGTKELAINFSMIPIRASGRTEYVLAEARDITSERTVDRAKSEFVTLASHQLRTPISAIGWFSEMLLSGDAGKLNEEQQDHVEQIYHSKQRMANLVDEMLIVSSLELGSLPVRPESLDVPSLCRKIVQDQVDAASEKQLTLKVRYDKSLIQVSFDPHILKTILRNLVSNAIKYTPQHGSISLEVARTTKKIIQGSEGSVAIIVSDDGYGIPAADQDKMFTKFFRAENIKEKDTDGTGLGLYIVKALLEYTGGQISFDSTEGKGSTFTVLLPIIHTEHK